MQFWLKFGEEAMIFPVNPENLLMPRDADNQVINVVGLGDVIIPSSPGLTKISIESIFPYGIIPGSSQYFPAEPIEYVNFINNAWISKKPLRFIVTEVNPINMQVSIEHFEYNRRAGEHEDIYYKLDLIEYIPYGAQIITVKDNNTIEPITEQRSNENKDSVGRTYTVKSGDSLWTITKRLSGDGSKYRELYELNKVAIGNNPDLIYPGTVLTMPEGWVTG